MTLSLTLFNPSAADAVQQINSSLSGEDSAQLLEALTSEHSHLEDIEAHEALHYLAVLRTARAAKIEVLH